MAVAAVGMYIGFLVLGHFAYCFWSIATISCP